MTQSDVAQAPLSSEEKQKTPRERIRWAAAGTALFLAGFVGETVLDEGLCCTNRLMAGVPLSPDRLIPRAL